MLIKKKSLIIKLNLQKVIKLTRHYQIEKDLSLFNKILENQLAYLIKNIYFKEQTLLFLSILITDKIKVKIKLDLNV